MPLLGRRFFGVERVRFGIRHTHELQTVNSQRHHVSGRDVMGSGTSAVRSNYDVRNAKPFERT
jgi:hypothetical protein